MMTQPQKVKKNPRSPRLPAFFFNERLKTGGLLHGWLMVWVLVTTVAVAAVGDEDSPPSSPRTPASQEPQVTALNDDSDGAAAKVNVVIEFLAHRFQEAEVAYRNGQFEKAWKTCEAILVLAPEQFPLRFEVGKLRRRAHGRHLSRSALVIRFEIAPVEEEEIQFPLALLQGSVVVENLSKEEIQFGESDEDPLLGQLIWVVKEVYEDGTSRSSTDMRNLRIDSGFRVEAGGSRGIPITLPLSVPSATPILQQWSVTGATMPIRLVTPEGEVRRGVPWVEERGLATPRGYQEVERDPAGEMRRALLEGDRVRMAIATHLWLEARNEGATPSNPADPIVDDLLASLGSHRGALDGYLVMLLEEVTGLIRERSARAWKIWGVTRQVRGETNDKKD